jgi:hypothetical protein
LTGAGNESGKISRIKKANKWTGYVDDTLRKGFDTAAYGYEEYKRPRILYLQNFIYVWG